MQEIGFTTGCLYKSGMPVDKIAEFYSTLGANAIELSFSNPFSLRDFKLSKNLIKSIERYDFVSVHAPWKEIKYTRNTETISVLKKLERLQEQLSTNGIVFHPDVIDNFDILADSPIKALIENMDSRKKLRTDVTFFRKLKEDYNFGFVLDLEHAYEHDNEMDLAKELILIMNDRLSHLHVSGCSEKEIHFPLYLSKNKDKIARVLELKLQIPKILEGLLSGNIQRTALDELSFIKGYS